LIAIILAGVMAMPIQLLGQQTPGQPAQAPPASTEQAPTAANWRVTPAKLNILVLEGQNAVNSISTSTAVSPVVQVLDSSNQPLDGVEVVFEVSTSGPGGTFANQQPVIKTRTDSTGQVMATFTPNKIAGPFTIKVTASTGTAKGEALIRQVNDGGTAVAGVPPPPKPWFKNWKWWAVILGATGGGIATGVYFYNRSNTPTITIAPGPIVIGGPR
jgi:hypothetical protein